MYQVLRVDASHVVPHNGPSTGRRFTCTTIIVKLLLLLSIVLIRYTTTDNKYNTAKTTHEIL